MPIYSQTYKAYDGKLIPARWRFLFLVRNEFLPLLKKRALIFLLILSLIPFAIFFGNIFIQTQLTSLEWVNEIIKSGGIKPIDTTLFMNYQKNGWVLFTEYLMLAWIGGGLIAKDKKNRMMEIYFSKPLSFWEYLLSKWLSLIILPSIVSLIPPIILFLSWIGFTHSFTTLFQNASLLLSIPLSFIVCTGGISILVLALSSLSSMTKIGGFIFFGALIGSDALGSILFTITGIPETYLLSINKNIEGTICFIYGNSGSEIAVNPALSFVALIILCLLSVTLLRITVKPVEWVK